MKHHAGFALAEPDWPDWIVTVETEMEYEQDPNAVSFVSGLILGAVLGAGIALLTAPDSGHRTRRRIRKVATEAKDSACDQLEDFAEDVKRRVDDAVHATRERFQSR